MEDMSDAQLLSLLEQYNQTALEAMAEGDLESATRSLEKSLVYLTALQKRRDAPN